jgi:hypothetical protein
MAPVLEAKSVGLDQKTVLKRELLQAATLYSTLERAQLYYWNLFSTTSIASCCCFGVWAPQLTVSTSNSYQPMGAAPVCLLSYPLGIWGLGSMTERRNYMIVV